MAVPFSDAKEPEVCARVATALVRRAYWKHPELGTRPVPLIATVIRDLPRVGFPILSTALIGMQYYVISKRGRIAEWKAIAVAGSRLGYNFRQCFYNEYKANRRR